MFDFNGDGKMDPTEEYLAYKTWENVSGMDEDEDEEEGDPDLLEELAAELEEEEAERELETLDEMDEEDGW